MILTPTSFEKSFEEIYHPETIFSYLANQLQHSSFSSTAAPPSDSPNFLSLKWTLHQIHDLRLTNS